MIIKISFSFGQNKHMEITLTAAQFLFISTKVMTKHYFMYSPTLIVLRSKHGPLCPLDLTTKSPVERAAEMTGQMLEALCSISSNSTLVTSFSAGHSLAHKITEVPLSSSALTNGKTPRTMSTPLLSTNTAAQWWTVFCNNDTTIE